MDIQGTEGQELVDYHPCAVAAGAGGIFGRMAGQSGQMAPENMLYSDWNDCMQGDINRDLLQAKAGMVSTRLGQTFVFCFSFIHYRTAFQP